MYIGKGYVNNPRVHDVVFVVEGKPFYAHKLALSASSETFRAMFDSGCLEGGTGIPEIQIPNLSRRVFEAMMMFVYTGEGGVADHLDILPELLQASPSRISPTWSQALLDQSILAVFPACELLHSDSEHRRHDSPGTVQKPRCHSSCAR